jgi:hypothetical protein
MINTLKRVTTCYRWRYIGRACIQVVPLPLNSFSAGRGTPSEGTLAAFPFAFQVLVPPCFVG